MDENIKIGVIGLGYVGLPLAHAFAKKGFNVVGFDINEKRIKELNEGFDRTQELDSNQILEIRNKIKFVSQTEEINSCNIYIVTVPTPIDKSNKPNLSPLIKSSQMIGEVLEKNDIVIYESTVYPGVTEEVCVKELEQFSGLIYNQDFYCGYSPERINPGDKNRTVF